MTSIPERYSFILDRSKFNRKPGFWSSPLSTHSDQNDWISNEENLNAYSGKNSFFNIPTDPKSQREDWYAVSHYIAEFWCTLSNIGFFYVGWRCNSPSLLFTGLASVISHTIPRQFLLYIDKAGVAVALSEMIIKHNITIINHPTTCLELLMGLFAINLIDARMARKYGRTWPHVLWHLSAAYIAYTFLTLEK
jgi:hypothetical protein